MVKKYAFDEQDRLVEVNMKNGNGYWQLGYKVGKQETLNKVLEIIYKRTMKNGKAKSFDLNVLIEEILKVSEIK